MDLNGDLVDLGVWGDKDEHPLTSIDDVDDLSVGLGPTSMDVDEPSPPGRPRGVGGLKCGMITHGFVTTRT